MDDDVRRSFHLGSRQALAGIGLSGKECVQLLDGVFSSGYKSHFALVIDALDECIDHDTLLDFLKQAIGSNKNFRVAFTSRLHDFLDLEIPKRRKGSSMTDEQVKKLENILVDRANGMFIQVKRQLYLFLDENKSKKIYLKKDVQLKLYALESSKTIGEERLYNTYHEVYDIAIGSGDSQLYRKEMVRIALCWVLCAFRSLTPGEFAYTISVRLDETEASEIQGGLILAFCSNLLVEDTTGIIRLQHLSVRDYLENRRKSNFSIELVHLQAAFTCFYFTESYRGEALQQYQENSSGQGNTTSSKSFERYVHTYWPRHCLNWAFSERDGYTDEARNSKIFEGFEGLISPSSYNIYEFIAQYIALRFDLNIQDPRGSTLLHEAIRFRQLGAVKALIDVGALLNVKNHLGNTPMHIASMHAFGK
ncbi:hypothetical protein F5Y11DRAFT_363396 [Daldinia sp. FL1419]|nr:hypothetical protein F5Y11DRAFT_363396 [Daldinia sp. FL1419]